MTPRDVTLVWAVVQAAHVLCFVVAWVQTWGRPLERLPVLLAAVPAMFGTWVYALFVQVWVMGDQGRSWAMDEVAWRTLWYPWWGWMLGASPLILGLGLWSLRFQPRRPFSMGARLTGILSTVLAVLVLASQRAWG